MKLLFYPYNAVRYAKWMDGMKRNSEAGVLLFLCAGIVIGLLMPRWIYTDVGNTSVEFLEREMLQQYYVCELEYNKILEKIACLRLITFFITYFSGYCAAGFWILSAVSLVMGSAAGFLCALSVIGLGYWGIGFCFCALLPQWLFYGYAGKLIAKFMEQRKRRTEFCRVNVMPVFDWKTLAEFFKILSIVGLGIVLEAYVNPGILRFFLGIYLNRR